MKLKLKGRIWLETENGIQFGAGRIELLEQILRDGSISNAARKMKMSYRQAWEQVESMNKSSKHPLVIKNSGGSGGGGSLVTEEGRKVIEAFRKIETDFLKYSKKNVIKV